MINTVTDYTQPEPDDISILQGIVGKDYVLIDPEKIEHYGHDETEDLNFRPALVALPGSTAEISEILRHTYSRNIPVTVRGAGSGLSGGALPLYGGVVLSLERLNKILEIDEKNLQVRTQPGVITEVLQNSVEENGLFYPPDPASKGWCFIGGNVATNSGGPRALKYGVVKDYVLDLEVVLPGGEIIRTGARTLKNSTGYNLTQLMVGSEGTLGVITEIVLKLIPRPAFNLLMLVPFQSSEDACAAVGAIFRAGITPSALEFMERSAIDWATRYVGDINVPVEPDIQAHLLIEVDGNYPDSLYLDCEKIAEVVSQFNAGEILFADSEAQKLDLWKLRRNVGHAVKINSIYKEEDTVVPRAYLPELLKGVKSIGAKYGFESVCYGHAGDGNLHVNILKQNMSDPDWQNKLPEGITEIFQLVKSLGGTISGEHGIGWVQKRYMPIVFSEVELRIMKGIKELFDPKNLMNPGKIFPD
jgi:glycolate oxidase